MTTQSTLLTLSSPLACASDSTRPTFFHRLLSGRIPALKDSHGNYFIDRNPKYFGYILDYLRSGAPSSLDFPPRIGFLISLTLLIFMLYR